MWRWDGEFIWDSEEAGKESWVVSCYPHTEVQETTCVGVGDGLSCFRFAEVVVVAPFKFTLNSARQL